MISNYSSDKNSKIAFMRYLIISGSPISLAISIIDSNLYEYSIAVSIAKRCWYGITTILHLNSHEEHMICISFSHLNYKKHIESEVGLTL